MAQLRLSRIAAGFGSQDALAADLGTDRSVVTKAETGERPPNTAVLKAWLDACDVSGQLRSAIEGMHKIARAREDPAKIKTEPWFETEARAHTLRYWAPVLVPGLVQVEAYASALYIAMGHDSDKIIELVDGRMARQKILTRADPPDVTIVLWEPVLHHMIGSPEVMRAQLTRLLGLSRRIVLHVLPGRVGANAGLGGPINLAAADGTPELLLSDGLVEDWLTNDPGQVRRASATFNNVRGDALPRAESRTVISEAMERWTT